MAWMAISLKRKSKSAKLESVARAWRVGFWRILKKVFDSELRVPLR